MADPQTRYYASPQQLNTAGQIIGHQHVVAQFVGLGGQPPDASVFDFFKGLDFPAINGNELSVTIPANTFTKRGEYRICTMTGASSHQPVIMPVAQRGPQDDCIRVTVN
jgi:transcription initiation factor TFIID subunit 15